MNVTATTTIKYYSVTCPRGHCGIGHSTEITFVFKAPNMLAAVDMAKRMPSVKHTRCVLSAKQITEAEYYGYRQVSAYERAPMGRR